MNLDLPFAEPDPSTLDAYLTEIDRALDELFMGAVSGELERLRLERLERLDPADDTAA